MADKPQIIFASERQAEVRRPLLSVQGIGVALTAMLVWASGAYAHNWYTGYTNEKKEVCCGGSDCAQLPDGDARAVEGGYIVDRLPEGFPNGSTVQLPAFVPNARAQPGEDPEHYHLCIWNAEIKCFFVPSPGF